MHLPSNVETMSHYNLDPHCQSHEVWNVYRAYEVDVCRRMRIFVLRDLVMYLLQKILCNQRLSPGRFASIHTTHAVELILLCYQSLALERFA